MMFKCKKRANQLLPLSLESRMITSSKLKRMAICKRGESSLIAMKKNLKETKTSRPLLQIAKEVYKLEEVEENQLFRRILPRK